MWTFWDARVGFTSFQGIIHPTIPSSSIARERPREKGDMYFAHNHEQRRSEWDCTVQDITESFYKTTTSLQMRGVQSMLRKAAQWELAMSINERWRNEKGFREL